MIENRVRSALQTEYEKRILVYDLEGFSSCCDYVSLLRSAGFSVYFYDDVERIRLLYETEIRNTDTPCAIIVTNHLFVPSDIKKAFRAVSLSLSSVYPKMDTAVLRRHIGDIGLIDASYDLFERNCIDKDGTDYYISKFSFSGQNVRSYIKAKEAEFQTIIAKGPSFREWIRIAQENARLEKYAAMHHIRRDQTFLDDAFREFVLSGGYRKLSAAISAEAPPILPRVMDHIATGEKAALVVADGMSMFDFEILSEAMTDYDYSYGGSFALIPTITSISRQSLLAGKYPQELEKPFSLAKEESGFYAAAQERGYTKQQSFYGRGYQAVPGLTAKLAAIIVNDIDDMVHGQKQGRIGMYQDVRLWAKEGKLLNLIDGLLERGFRVYLTADHGNTECVGVGGNRRTGVETETKSKRMMVLKDFADISDELREKTFEYPGFYSNKNYHYLICSGRTSFDRSGETVMTHGGISIEEVIVPFVEVRKKKHG